MENIPTQSIVPKNGVRYNTSNIHSKQYSGLSWRLKAAGIDWLTSFGAAIKRNDKQLLTIWLRLLPYLIVTQGHRKIKRSKGRASRAALQALDALEGKNNRGIE